MDFIKEQIKNLLPAYFALVMATGIISTAAYLHHFTLFATILFYLNLVFIAVLLIFLLLRVLIYSGFLIEDLKSYQKGPGFFTVVAASCIVGNQFILFFQQHTIATYLLVFSAIVWLLITYSFFYFITIHDEKQSIEKGINGTWLIIIVATQALSTLFTSLAYQMSVMQHVFLMAALCLFLAACMLYIYIMTLIFYRLSFFDLRANELGAPYWINMGATAISTLAGSMLIIQAENWDFLVEILPFLKGFTLFYWAAGTWWIPLLIVLGMWRHLIKKVPVPSSPKGYQPAYWGMVFPLGMYTTCTYQLSEALGLGFLKVIPDYFIYIAIFAWAAVMIGYGRSLAALFFKSELSA